MGNLFSRLFLGDRKGPVPSRDDESQAAYRLGRKDARNLPVNAFLDPEFVPPFVARARAVAAEEVARLEQALDDVRTSLAAVFSEAKRIIDLYTGEAEEAGAEYRAEPPAARTGLPFLTLDEATAERARLARVARAREATERINAAMAEIERTLRQWDLAHHSHLKKIEVVQARAEQIIASYRRGVLECHARKEDLVPIWRGQLFVLDVRGGQAPAKDVFHSELTSVNTQVDRWHRRHRPAIEAAPALTQGEPPDPGTVPDHPGGLKAPREQDPPAAVEPGDPEDLAARAEPADTEEAEATDEPESDDSEARGDAGEPAGSERDDFDDSERHGTPGGPDDRPGAEEGRDDPGSSERPEDDEDSDDSEGREGLGRPWGPRFSPSASGA